MASDSEHTRRWQAKRLAAGLCQWCGAPRPPGQARYCHLHLAWSRRLVREANARRRRPRGSSPDHGPADNPGR